VVGAQREHLLLVFEGGGIATTANNIPVRILPSATTITTLSQNEATQLFSRTVVICYMVNQRGRFEGVLGKYDRKWGKFEKDVLPPPVCIENKRKTNKGVPYSMCRKKKENSNAVVILETEKEKRRGCLISLHVFLLSCATCGQVGSDSATVRVDRHRPKRPWAGL
jgi:hypothetical protein